MLCRAFDVLRRKYGLQERFGWPCQIETNVLVIWYIRKFIRFELPRMEVRNHHVSSDFHWGWGNWHISVTISNIAYDITTNGIPRNTNLGLPVLNSELHIVVFSAPAPKSIRVTVGFSILIWSYSSNSSKLGAVMWFVIELIDRCNVGKYEGYPNSLTTATLTLYQATSREKNFAFFGAKTIFCVLRDMDTAISTFRRHCFALSLCCINLSRVRIMYLDRVNNS